MIWIELTRVLGGEMLRLGGVVATGRRRSYADRGVAPNGEALQRFEAARRCKGDD